jgi:hypothetical protein
LPLLCPIEGVSFPRVIIQTDHAGHGSCYSPSNVDAIGDAFPVIGVVTRRINVVDTALRSISETVGATTVASKIERQLRIGAGATVLTGGL